jgi:hypothetical protein
MALDHYTFLHRGQDPLIINQLSMHSI